MGTGGSASVASCLPTGSSPGKYSFSKAWLTIATRGFHGAVVPGKVTSAHEFGAYCLEVIRAYVSFRNIVVLAVPRTAQHAEPGRVTPVADGKIGGDSDGFDARQAAAWAST